MKRILAAALLCLVLSACGAPSAADYARDQAEAQHYDLAAERERELAPLYTALTGLAYGLLGLAAVGAVAYIGGVAALDTRRRALEVKALAQTIEAGVLPTPDGRLPVPLGALPAASLLALGLNAAPKQLAATDHALPHALSLPEPVLIRLLEAPTE